MLSVGSHDFIVRFKNPKTLEYEWSIHNTMVDIRLEPIPKSKFFLLIDYHFSGQIK